MSNDAKRDKQQQELVAAQLENCRRWIEESVEKDEHAFVSSYVLWASFKLWEKTKLGGNYWESIRSLNRFVRRLNTHADSCDCKLLACKACGIHHDLRIDENTGRPFRGFWGIRPVNLNDEQLRWCDTKREQSTAAELLKMRV